MGFEVSIARADRLARDLMISEILLGEFRKLGVKVIAADSDTELTVEGDDPTKLIAIMHVILKELEEILCTAPERTDEEADPRNERLRNQIDRLDAVLKKREAHSRRQKSLDRENRKNNPRR